ncbi:DNA polymerase III, epsilon subunit [Campylobacter blaseri]|uniref:DNA polymerase III subunit epsilon n=1 Tax=Campylobacter blaseri TaxID=2042961 RepID=A0A2P8R1Z3_9BACT|nr:3'-5' exonuclease [Campylobacter blaseri]PSM52515.1 DNA polymerase III subunit epsilon [Campylobacter blaseri]PSM54163.1 DNA polymerase III subunit epsilon [Campylobacter blaseri]QKF85813.1 DNA polymerase III, epsilon subunit [Campylobacter blaseri]
MNIKTDNLLNLLAAKSINYYDFIHNASNIEEIVELFDPKDFSMWRALGANVIKLDNGKITLKTRETNIEDQVFCIVDIETSGGINSGQIIEIGALKIKNKEIISKFETFIKAKEIPENITELTGISVEDVKNAPSLKNVLEKFRIFLGDSVFVAHNVEFDYGFISKSMENLGYGPLLNRRLCTINLARRTIPSKKYGLCYLKELLGIENTHHRALNDAISAFEVFKTSLKFLPWTVQSTEDLIEFSKKAPPVKIIKKEDIS